MDERIRQHEDWQRVPFRAFIREHLARNGFAGELPKQADWTGAVNALINHGRWLVECPVEGCGGALTVSREESYFLCVYCRNVDNGGQWYRVLYPGARTEIETLLLARPLAGQRNWRPGESVAQLRQENAQRNQRNVHGGTQR